MYVGFFGQVLSLICLYNETLFCRGLHIAKLNLGSSIKSSEDI